MACENLGGTLASTSNDSAKAAANAPLRDVSITSANSYSDLFLDSTALDAYIKSRGLNDSMARELKNFYNVRNYQFAWFNSEGFTEEGKGFWSLYDYVYDHGDSIKENKSLANRMDTLTENDSLIISTGDSSFISTELSLTKEFIKYSNTFKDYVGFSDVYHFVPVKKMDVMELADSILNKTDSVNSYGDSTNKSNSLKNQSTVNHSNTPYNLLKEQLRTYYNIAQKEGWQPIPLGTKKFTKGKSYAVVPAIKKRLMFTGELAGPDTARVYNDSLEAAIINYKIHHGFDSSATITDSLITDMNIPVKQRIEQILINMNRMMWIPNISSPQLIEVNIPEFMLKVYEGSSKAFDMKVVVGKEGANTTMFSGDLNQIVFSPYWNIPASIVEEEILPAMKADAGYLQKNHMEIVKKNDSLPVIRQVPGPDNPMGKVKFLFPNSYEIFFHDTPAKNLFTKDKRAFSHGCIRLEDAKKLAEYLLKDDPSWTPEKIEQAMNSGKEQFVQGKKPVPVMITYFTAWTDQNGKLNFRDDVYSHDAKTRARMFGTTSALQQPPYTDSMQKDTTKGKI
jgi:murein L,D-transpeptidase YcbB/YkuD